MAGLERRELHPTETVYARSRPSAFELFVPALVCAGVLAAAALAYLAWRHGPGWYRDALLAIGLAAVLYLAERVMRWRAEVLLLTNERIVTRVGLMHRNGREIPLEIVREVHYEQRLLEKVRGRGTLVVVCAGGQTVAPFHGVRRPALVQQVVGDLAARRRAQLPGAVTTDEVPVVRAHAPSPQQLEDLHVRGVITDREYEQRRAQIFGR